jgi:GMP synthase (glutamine-hydrolysing)
MPNVLILDNSVDPGLYRPVEHWGRTLGCDLHSVRYPAGERPASLDPFTHVIVTGSEASITADDPWIEAGCRTIRELARRGVPILASCFGHQQIVRALSGREFVRRSPTPEFGWVRLVPGPAAADDPLASALPCPTWVYAAHFDEVHPLPDGWDVLAASDRCPHAVIRLRGAPVWGFQHHPEIEAREGQRLFDEFVKRLPDRRETMLDGFRDVPRDSCVTPGVVARFLAL